MDLGKVDRTNNNNNNNNNDKNNKQRTMVVMKEELHRDQEEEVQNYCGAEPEQIMMGSTFENDNKNHSKKKKGGGIVLGSSSSGGKKSSSSSGGEAVMGRCCQAEMCTADLSDAKHYHRRHKVCEHHAKAQFVLVAGLRQRFCQQCSRFHELSEFDETRRSCRRRLAGHNERRRKSSMETQAEGSGRKGTGTQLKDMACGGQVDDNRGKIQIGVKENATYKHFQFR